jgi:hypothetical protein
MRYRIWLLALVVSVGLGCAKEEPSDASPAAAATTPTPPPSYKLQVTFEGLVGYVNKTDGVWALLPKAKPSDSPPVLPPSTQADPDYYPTHFAVLIISGMNLRGFDQPVTLKIPIDGYDLQLPTGLAATGNLDGTKFMQDPSDSAVDKLNPDMIAEPMGSEARQYLTTRMKLPLGNFTFGPPNGQFFRTVPIKNAPNHTICFESEDTGSDDEVASRAESVTWTSPNLNTDIDLSLILDPTQSSPTAAKLTLHPAAGENLVAITVANKVAGAVLDDHHEAEHWPAYRWFYNLSTVAVRTGDCTKHYYPQGTHGGNRCPQKLFTD